jgi:hypothetical protein
LKTLHEEGKAGNLSTAAESVPILGSIIKKANADLNGTSMTTDISGAKADVAKAETTVKSGFARIEAEVKKII